MQPSEPSPLRIFDRIEIINLPHRADRRRAVTAELAALGEHIDRERVAFLPALRPENAGAFDTIGTRGCFLSHLAALKKAQADGVQSLLILEDDVAFSAGERRGMRDVFQSLGSQAWDVFYGGSPVDAIDGLLTRIAPETPVMLAHFIAFSRSAIDQAVPYLEAILRRPPGSPEGGPMHVDGAYGWLRRANPQLITFAATPIIAHQRSSATDIHDRRGLDRFPLLRNLLGPARAFRNWRRSRQ